MELNSPGLAIDPSRVFAADDRQPGRFWSVDPSPLMMLRNAAKVDVALPRTAEADLPHDKLAFVRGFVLGVALNVPLWAIIGSVAWWFVF